MKRPSLGYVSPLLVCLSLVTSACSSSSSPPPNGGPNSNNTSQDPQKPSPPPKIESASAALAPWKCFPKPAHYVPTYTLKSGDPTLCKALESTDKDVLPGDYARGALPKCTSTVNDSACSRNTVCEIKEANLTRQVTTDTTFTKDSQPPAKGTRHIVTTATSADAKSSDCTYEFTYAVK